MGRRSTATLVSATLIALLLASYSSSASSPQEQDFVSRVNAARSSRGLSALAERSDLTDVARRWAAHMAAEGTISHNPNLRNEVSGWTALGDNVGKGPSVARIHEAFMESATHREIILDPDFTQIGVGVVVKDGTLYVSQVFARRAASRTTTTVRETAPTATTRTSAAAPASAALVLSLTGRIWHIDLVAPPVTVTVLEQLLALDAP